MSNHEVPGDELAALEDERAFVDLSSWRKVRVSGGEARTWLGDLLTADVASLEPGHGCRSLLLTATGRIRADVQVARREDDLLLMQAPDQPEHVGLALGPYALSSDVLLEDATEGHAMFALPGRAAGTVGHSGSIQPSALGTGIDIVVAAGEPAWRLMDTFVAAGLSEAGEVALEAWRVRRGIPRMGVDFDDRSLPAEAGLESAIAFDKGCFLGQEAVARVRNLGHPPRVLRHVRARGTVRVGEPVFADGGVVGQVTSATGDGPEGVALVRVRWEASGAPLSLTAGRTLIAAGMPG